MKVLIGCEFSGIVRDAFISRGHDAVSCDIEPSERPGPHIKDNLLNHLEGWDLIIAHPPCTYLANSGAKHLYLGMKKQNGRDPDRWERMAEAVKFFRAILNAPVASICVENPIMVGHAQRLIGKRHSQVIQPWLFGHGEIKATCFWLRGLDKLVPTHIVEGRNARVHKASPGPNRWKERSRTLAGIAIAMAEQWG